MDITDLRNELTPWRKKFLRLKEKNKPEAFTWYGYDTLSNVEHLNRLLTGENRDIFSKIKTEPVADMGAADGDLAYFLHDQGFDVDIIDWPATNWNGLRGAQKLKELTGSKVNIHAVDLDSAFELPRSYGLVIFLGILYHLQNPFYVLSRLAKQSKYCCLSTRIAAFTTSPQIKIEDIPLAYLLAPDECNNDATNYWIFSITGLRRLVTRCGWVILDESLTGDSQASNPSEPDHDQRAFMFLQSTFI